jgi:hypothetical protein
MIWLEYPLVFCFAFASNERKAAAVNCASAEKLGQIAVAFHETQEPVGSRIGR